MKVEEKQVVPWRDAWCRAAEKLPKLSMSVDNPSQAGSALSRHVTYRVRTRVSREDGGEEEFEVCRRFSEFATLREALVQRYVGLLVPPIPPKALTSIASMSAKAADRQTKQRLRVLSLFSERLGSIPWLCDDGVLRSFCGASKEPFGKAVEDDAAGAGAIATDEAGLSGRGRALWYATVQRSEPAPPVAELARLLADVNPRLARGGQGANATSLQKLSWVPMTRRGEGTHASRSPRGGMIARPRTSQSDREAIERGASGLTPRAAQASTRSRRRSRRRSRASRGARRASAAAPRVSAPSPRASRPGAARPRA